MYRLLDTAYPSGFDAKSLLFDAMTDVSAITLVNSNGAVTVSFASAASPRKLMTTNDIAFSPYPSYRQWKKVFTQVCGSCCRSSLMILEGSNGRTDLHARRVLCDCELQHSHLPTQQYSVDRLWFVCHLASILLLTWFQDRCVCSATRSESFLLLFDCSLRKATNHCGNYPTEYVRAFLCARLMFR
jgi:hypothetical protein